MDKVTITSRVPDDLLAWLDGYAEQRRWSRATAIQALLEQAREREKER